jgi:hypothetical protein
VSAPAVTFANPRTAARALLDDRMAETVGTAFPTSTQVGTKTAPTAGYLQVGWDGTPGTDYPATIHATIRVTAWHVNPSPAEDLALEALGQLASTDEGTATLWTVRHLTGPLSGVDADSGWNFSYITVRVSPKPTPL